MAEWIPPKTNWSVEDVPGPEDFKRIERNIDSGGQFMMPSDNIILSAPAARTNSDTTYSTVKRFRVHYEGIYRIVFEALNAVVRAVSAKGIGTNYSVLVSSTTYQAASIDVYAPAGSEIEVQLSRYIASPSAGIIRNVRLCGTLKTRKDLPTAAVMLD